MLHIAATVQMRHPGTLGKAYYDRKRAAGKRPLEAMRCLKRRLSDVVYRQLVKDAVEAEMAKMNAGPGGHSGATIRMPSRSNSNWLSFASGPWGNWALVGTAVTAVIRIDAPDRGCLLLGGWLAGQSRVGARAGSL